MAIFSSWKKPLQVLINDMKIISAFLANDRRNISNYDLQNGSENEKKKIDNVLEWAKCCVFLLFLF